MFAFVFPKQKKVKKGNAAAHRENSRKKDSRRKSIFLVKRNFDFDCLPNNVPSKSLSSSNELAKLPTCCCCCCLR